jgi:hypothetical protein
MNCANHPDVTAAAYCQNCGKPLCTACVRSVGGVVYCEPCLAARLAPAATQPGVDFNGMHAHPLLAGLLGFIPGVGAMYNGQFVKALAHVLIFAVFVSLSDKSFVFGLLVAAWVFYQVFDAAQTAKARRDGLPLPNPFGLNDLGARLGMAPAAPYVPGFPAAPPPPPGTPVGPHPGPDFAVDPTAASASTSAPMPGAGPEAASAWNPVPPPPGYAASYAVPPVNPGAMPGPMPGPPYTVPPYPVPPVAARPRHPLGAVILIAIGVLLLLNTLGVFEMEWIGRAWPLVLIAIGGWLLYRRTQENNPRGGL